MEYQPFSDTELDAMAAITEDFCPPHDEYLRLIAQAKRANAFAEQMGGGGPRR